MELTAKDSTGKTLLDGDTVQLTRDLKVKGSSTNLKRGTAIKNIRLTNNSEEIECRIGKATIVLKTAYLKKKA
jgi:protein PhnA